MEHPPHIRYSEEEERYGTLGNNNLMFVKTTIRWKKGKAFMETC